MVDTTELLENTLGYCGRWQVMIVILLFLSRFSVAYHPLLMVVQHYEPEKMMCFKLKDLTLKPGDIKPGDLKATDIKPGDVPNLFMNSSKEDLLNVFIKGKGPKCPDGCTEWIYTEEVYKETVVTQYHLVCDRKWIASLVQSLVMAGILLGNLTLGWVSDKFGRKKLLVAEIIVQVVAGTISGFMKDCFAAFLILRVVAAYATGGIMLTGFILLMEFVAKKHRTVIGILFHLPFQLGHASLGAIAYIYPFPTWSGIQMSCTVQPIILLCYICLLPESIRWLVTKDRAEDVVKILEKAAKCNGLPTDDINSKVVSLMKQQATAQGESGRCGDLCSTKRMGTKMIVLSINWFVVEIVFYGVAELMAKLEGDPFLNVMASGVAQVPGTLICLLICKVFGNKISLIASYIVTFVPMIVMMVLPSDPNWSFLLCESVSIMGCSMSFAIIYLYTAELIPNVIRNLGMGVTLGIGSFGGMVAPFIVYANSTSSYIPYITFVALPVIAALLTLFFLPNTKDIEMPDTVEEADNL